MDINAYDCAEAVRIAREKGTVSTSLLQRRMRIGYAKAAKFIDLMDETGLCTPLFGTAPRRLRLDDLTNVEAAQKMVEKWKSDGSK